MTLTEFNSYNSTKTMPRGWIGQGYGYAMDIQWETTPDDEIIYIPEYGYEVFGDGSLTVKRENAYSKADIRKAVREYIISEYDEKLAADDALVDSFARDVYEGLDWQFPESLIYEGYMDDALEELWE